MRVRVAAFVNRAIHGAGGGPPATPPLHELERLALDLFAWQRARSPVADALAAGVESTSLATIPAVPVDLFKQLDVATLSAEEATVVFRTSGTTQGARGVVRLRDTALYDLGARGWARACIPDLPTRVVSLCSHAADSSLGHMVADFATTLDACFDSGTGVADDAWARIARASMEGPIFLACTAFALDALLAHPGVAHLGADSVVMVTGGFKGREVRLDAPSLYRALPERLGAPRVVGEYGMTELSSQLWTRPVPAGEVPGAFRAPPWMHVVVVDPVTGRVTDGEGQLRFVDLCNVDSAVAIETLDLGSVKVVDGIQQVALLGRIPGAEARGCSLTAEAFARGLG